MDENTEQEKLNKAVKYLSADDEKREKELQEKGLNAPRLSPQMIAEQILTEQFYVFPGTVMTVCCLTLQNGFNVVGTSAPASADNFNAEIGQSIARGKAVEQIWQLEGYLLKHKIKEGKI
jgi:hypothetical protein